MREARIAVMQLDQSPEARLCRVEAKYVRLLEQLAELRREVAELRELVQPSRPNLVLVRTDA
jgi:hypothetical protein